VAKRRPEKGSEPIRATVSDLPTAVAAALQRPTAGERNRVDVNGLSWATLSCGSPGDPPMLLVHGVTSEALTFWRIGPALAATGRRVIAVDLPGHGLTGGWSGRHRFAQTAQDLAGFIRAAGLDRTDLVVLGHSWGGMVVAGLPAAGIRPAVLILLDPPAQTRDELEWMTRDPSEVPYPTLAEARAAIRAANPSWADGDVDAKAQGVNHFDAQAVLAILLENGDYDAGLAALSDPAAAGIPVWFIRGEFSTGGLIPEEFVPRLVARVGADHVLTIADGPHSPQRTHPEATLVAILRALDSVASGAGSARSSLPRSAES
jgi:pimeloyl-ACP methyl ester carboxylesterase